MFFLIIEDSEAFSIFGICLYWSSGWRPWGHRGEPASPWCCTRSPSSAVVWTGDLPVPPVVPFPWSFVRWFGPHGVLDCSALWWKVTGQSHLPGRGGDHRRCHRWRVGSRSGGQSWTWPGFGGLGVNRCQSIHSKKCLDVVQRDASTVSLVFRGTS